MAHPVQTPAQELAHKRLKFEAARHARANLASTLADVQARILAASRPRSLADPVFANRLPALLDQESKLKAQLADFDKQIAADYADVMQDAPIKSRQDAEIDRLQGLVAMLSDRMEKCRCGASVGR